MKDEELKPRFVIHKNRIRDNGQSQMENPAFSPDKVIYIEIDDEITVVFDRVKRVRGKKIALVIPKRAVILQSIINLKILKKKLDELEKEIVIVTTDVSGMQLAVKAGIPCTDKLFNKEDSEKMPEKPHPLLVGQRPVRRSGEKVSISDVIRKGKTEFFLSVLERMRKKFRKKKQEATETKLIFIAPNKQALFTLILVSVLLLLTIAYIALPGATVYLTPRSSILDPAFNITFLDYTKNRDLFEDNDFNTITIASFPVRPQPFVKKFKYNSTGKTFRGENSRGNITIYNLSPNPWDLSARTRFQTEDGLVFRIQNAVRVPQSRGKIPGTLTATVIADEFDINNQPIGARGNIQPTRFLLPGLRTEESRSMLYAENKTAFSGGVTNVIKSVSQQDIAASRESVRRDIFNGAIDDLKRFLEQENLAKRTNLSLLTDRNVIQISEPMIETPNNLIGQTTDQFEVTTQYTLSGIAYDRQQLIDALKERLLNRVDPDKKILDINDEDISYRFLDMDQSAGKVRLTATMRAIQVYELDPDKENGHRFLKKLTDHILGMSARDAMTYIQQQTDEISKVEITLWPIWAPSLPTIADNIKFVIREENSSQQ